MNPKPITLTKRVLLLVVWSGAVALGAPGCATLAHGPAQRVVITSDPAGAEVFLNDKPAGTTPVVVRMWRRRPPTVTVEKVGYARRTVKVKRTISGWVGVDIATSLNPFIGQGMVDPPPYPVTAIAPLVSLVGIDLVTGAAFRLPPHVNVTLCPVAEAMPERCGPGK